MRFDRRTWLRWNAAACLALAACLVGCGTAEYEERVQASIKQLKLENKFVGLEPTETLLAALRNDQGVGAKVSFRKPTYFAGQAVTVDSADPRNPTAKLNPERVKPHQLMDFPGFQFSYEQRSAGALGVAYAYYGALPTDAGTADLIEEAFKKWNQEINPPPEPKTWTTVQVDTTDGGSVPWRKIEMAGPNVFWFEGNPQADHLGGTMVIWMREEKGVQILFGLRTTTMNVDLDYLKKMMTASAGTVRVASPAKID